MDGSKIQSQLMMLIARIAIRIMSDTRDEEKDRNKDQGVLQDTQDPRTNCKIYDTGNILNSIILVLYQSTVTCIHKFRLYYSTTHNAIPKVSTIIYCYTVYIIRVPEPFNNV